MQMYRNFGDLPHNNSALLRLARFVFLGAIKFSHLVCSGRFLSSTRKYLGGLSWCRCPRTNSKRPGNPAPQKETIINKNAFQGRPVRFGEATSIFVHNRIHYTEYTL